MKMNLRKLRSLSIPMHKDNVESNFFKLFLESSELELETISLFGFANDKRDSDRLRIIQPLRNVENLHTLGRIYSLQSIELTELSCSDTSFLSELEKK